MQRTHVAFLPITLVLWLALAFLGLHPADELGRLVAGVSGLFAGLLVWSLTVLATWRTA